MLKKLSIILLSGIITLGLAFFFGCDSPSSDFTDFVAIENAATKESEETSDKDIFGLKYSHSLDTEYAKVFTVDYYEEGYVLLTVKEDDSKYLIVLYLLLSLYNDNFLKYVIVYFFLDFLLN